MRKYVSLVEIICILIISSVGSGQSRRSECPPDTWPMISELCARALAFPQEYMKYVKERYPVYSKNRSWERCSRVLAAQLVRSAWTRLSIDDELEYKAREIAERSGLPDIWPNLVEVAARITKDKIRLGYWINAITNATLDILNGKINSYAETEPYFQMTNIWREIEDRDKYPNMNILRELSFTFIAWIMLQYANSVD